MKFRPGQKVVCIHRGTWTSITAISKTPVLGSGPQFNEICTIIDYYTINGINGYKIAGYEINAFTGKPMGFIKKWFEPLVDDAVLEAELQSIDILEKI